MITNKFRATCDLHPLERIRVIDGDTIQADILLPFNQRYNARIRLKGWWADECEGRYRSAGLEAKARLEWFVAGRALSLFAPTCRLDKYGRVVAQLMHMDRIITGHEVLGELQLTEAQHKAHRDQISQDKAEAKNWPNFPATYVTDGAGPRGIEPEVERKIASSMTTAGTESESLISNPEAICPHCSAQLDPNHWHLCPSLPAAQGGKSGPA